MRRRRRERQCVCGSVTGGGGKGSWRVVGRPRHEQRSAQDKQLQCGTQSTALGASMSLDTSQSYVFRPCGQTRLCSGHLSLACETGTALRGTLGYAAVCGKETVHEEGIEGERKENYVQGTCTRKETTHRGTLLSSAVVLASLGNVKRDKTQWQWNFEGRLRASAKETTH